MIALITPWLGQHSLFAAYAEVTRGAHPIIIDTSEAGDGALRHYALGLDGTYTHMPRAPFSYAAACNRGLEVARLRGATHAVCLNNDIAGAPDWLADVARLPEPRTWQDVMDSLAAVRTEDHAYRTLVVDPVNWLEPLCWAHVTGGKGAIDQRPWDYGKGYVAALGHWRVMQDARERIWTERRMHVVLIAHAEVKRFENPMGEAWNHYVPAMNEKAASLFKRWVDHLLFLQVEHVARKGEDGRTLGKTTGARIAHTSPCAAYDAKCRGLPPELMLQAAGGWDVFFEAVTKGQIK